MALIAKEVARNAIPLDDDIYYGKARIYSLRFLFSFLAIKSVVLKTLNQTRD